MINRLVQIFLTERSAWDGYVEILPALPGNH